MECTSLCLKIVRKVKNFSVWIFSYFVLKIALEKGCFPLLENQDKLSAVEIWFINTVAHNCDSNSK